MKKVCVFLGVLGLCAFILGAQAEAQMQPVPPPVSGNPMFKGKGGGGYNPATVVTVSGTVAQLNRSTPKRPNQQPNYRMTLQTPQGAIPVVLGPAAFIDQQPVRLAPGDVVEVTGSQVTKGRRTRIIAAQIRKGNQFLRLRDESGRPLWRGMRRRR